MSIWAPWQPKVGARVVVRVSAECPADHAYFDGAVGTVESIGWSDELGDEGWSGDPGVDAYRWHWYSVDLDRPVTHPTEHRPIVNEIFASVELVPLD